MAGREKDFILDDGQVVNASMVRARCGISKSTAGLRLRNSSDPTKVFAPKGAMVGQDYTGVESEKRKERAKKKREEGGYSNAVDYKTEQELMEEHIRATREFYMDYKMLKLSLTYNIKNNDKTNKAKAS